LQQLNRQKNILLFSTLVNGFTFYLLTSLLPIYLTEEAGLGWSKEAAFSLFGSYFGFFYVTPLIGGLISDFLLGPFWTILLGFCLSLAGIGLFFSDVAYHYLLIPLIIFALGNGFTKVCLTTVVGNQQSSQKKQKPKYEAFYITGWLGFILGHFVSYPPYRAVPFQGVLFLEITLLVLCFSLYFWGGPSPQHKQIDNTSQNQKQEGTPLFFFLILLLSFPFFLFSTQNTSSGLQQPVMYHHVFDRWRSL